jgi:hypothetical protein
VMKRYRLTVEKTARNWRHYAAQALDGKLASPQAELFPTDPGSAEKPGPGEGD